VNIPTSGLSPRPNPRSPPSGRGGLSGGDGATSDSDDDALQDWNERASSLFEWIGMVNIGAQRLQANDRVDPYVAVYSAPAPSVIGDMVHIRWHGFLNPQFTQRVFDTATQMASCSNDSLIGVTIHGSTGVPVLTPHRVPRLEGEDTASVILAPESVGEAVTGNASSWMMVECVGKWDSRFG